MSNEKHYSTHPGAEHPPTMCMEIPVEEYESIKRENRKLKRALWLARAERAMAESYSVLNDVSTSNRWVKALNKLKAKADEFKEAK